MRSNVQLAAVPAWVRQTLSYGAIGAVCASISNLIVITGSLAGIDYWNAAVLAFVLVTPLGYVLQSRFTFDMELSARRFIHFAGSVAVGAVLFLALIGLFHSVFGMPVWSASPLATLLIVCWNYVASCWAISPAAKESLYSMASSCFSTRFKSAPTIPGKRLSRD